MMKKLLPISLLCGLVIIFFWKIVSMGWIFFEGDIIYIFYPIKLFYAENLKKFNLPLWLPYIQCGFPVFAVGNQGFLYPINLLLFFSLPTPIAYNLSYIIHYILAGVFTYFYATVIGLPKTPALISGIIFMFSGFLLAHLAHMDILNSVIWLPLILTFIEKIIREEKRRYIYVILSGIFIGIQILAGHQQMTFYSLLCISLYFFFGILSEHRRQIGEFLFIFVLVMMIGIGISAIQIIPTYELLSLSNRGGGINLKFANTGNFPPINFIIFIIPYFWGDVVNYYGKWNFAEEYGYIGIFTLVLLPFAIFRRGNRYIYFFCFLSILSAILMLGSITPLYTLLWHLPIFNSIRAPARFCYLLTFSLSILAGFGIYYLINFNYNKKIAKILLYLFFPLILISIGLLSIIGLERFLPEDFSLDRIKSIQEDAYVSLIFLSLSLLILIFWVNQKIGKISFSSLLLSFIIIDLFLFGSRALPNIVKIEKLPSILAPQTAKFLLQDKDIYRIMSIYPGRTIISSKEENIDLALAKLLAPSLNIYTHISHMNMIFGLVCVKYWEEMMKIFRKGTPPGCIKEEEVIPLIIKNIPLLNLFNIKYILFPLNINDRRFPTVFEDNGVKVIENKQVLPRVFVVHNFKVIKEKEKALEELSSKGFNPEHYVILDEDPKVNIHSNPTPPSIAKIINYGNEEVIIHCQMRDKGFLVLTDIYYPGWQVYIDNKKGEIYRAYHTFRAVYLEKGNHLVKFKYEPLSFKIGLCISLLTLCGIAIFFFISTSLFTPNKSKVL